MALPKLDAPRFELTVPSTGQKVVYRPYLVKEEKILMMAMESNDESQMIRGIQDVISACTDNGIDSKALTMFDLEFIFSHLRSKSVGESAEVKLNCESCGESNDVAIDLSAVTVDGIDTKGTKIKLTDQYTMVMKYPSVHDLALIQKSDKNDIDKTFDLLAMCIDSLHTPNEVFDMREQSPDEVKEFIESLSAAQFEMIKEFIENMPTAKIHAAFTCSKCGGQNDIDIKGMANFFS